MQLAGKSYNEAGWVNPVPEKGYGEEWVLQQMQVAFHGFEPRDFCSRWKPKEVLEVQTLKRAYIMQI